MHLPIDVSKDPTVEVDEALVRQAIEVVLGEQAIRSACRHLGVANDPLPSRQIQGIFLVSH